MKHVFLVGLNVRVGAACLNSLSLFNFAVAALCGFIAWKEKP